MKTYTTKQVSQILGLTVPGVLTAAKTMGVQPAKIPALTRTGFTYEFSEDQLDLLRSRPKRGPKPRKKQTLSIVIDGPPYFEDDQPCGYCNRPIGSKHESWCRQ